jgi:hypothetical protein
MGFPLDR